MKQQGKTKNIKKRKIMWIILSIIGVILIGGLIFINMPHFGKTPRGERKEQIKNVYNYYDGKFQNTHETKQITSDKGFLATMWQFLSNKTDRLHPEHAIPTIQTNLWQLSRDEDVLIWFGHSSYFLQTDGIRIVVDPVLSGAGSPVPFFNKPFKGTEVYKPDDIPEIDYLIISHDHWDHLDYKTVMNLKNRTGNVICGLGVGEHFEYWGFENVVELNWNEEVTFNNGITIYCLPARHFSGRSIFPNQSLWASYLVETPSQNIYIGGDSGYDTHYEDIGKRFEGIDLAILENGQYDKDWRYIHILPEQIIKAFNDLKAKRLFTVHHSKFALGNHPWDDPLNNITSIAEKDSVNLIQPMIGEKVNLKDSIYVNKKWWKGN